MKKFKRHLLPYFFTFVVVSILGSVLPQEVNAQQIEIKRGNIFTPWKYKLSTEDDSEYRSIYNKKRPLLQYFESDSIMLERYLNYLVLNDFKRAANSSYLLVFVAPVLFNQLFNTNNFGVLFITAAILISAGTLIAPILAIVQHFTFKSVMRKYNQPYYETEDIEILIE